MDMSSIILTFLLYMDISVHLVTSNPVNITELLVEAVSALQNETEVVNLELNLDLTLDEYVPIRQRNRQSNLHNSNSQQTILSQRNRNSSPNSTEGIQNSSEGEAVETESPNNIRETPPCPTGFLRHKNSCYHIIGSSELTWSIANTYCQLHESKLVEIDSESEQRYIENMIKANRDGEAYWIGATNRLGKGNWTWESSSEPMGYTMWVSRWSGFVDEIEAPSCALIDTTEFNQWMFWPCDNNFFMTGKKRSKRTGIGLICEKESPRSPRANRHTKSKRRRRLRRERRRNWLHTRHWRRFQQ